MLFTLDPMLNCLYIVMAGVCTSFDWLIVYDGG